jgi:hypothetical protein
MKNKNRQEQAGSRQIAAFSVIFTIGLKVTSEEWRVTNDKMLTPSVL